MRPARPEALLAASAVVMLVAGPGGKPGTPQKNAFGVRGKRAGGHVGVVEDEVPRSSSCRINARELFVLHEIPKRRGAKGTER